MPYTRDSEIPTQNSSDNEKVRDVVGNKTDTAAGDSLVAMAKNILSTVGSVHTVSSGHRGSGATTDVLFTLTGSVEVTKIYGVVTTCATPGVEDTLDNLKLVLYDGTNTVDITLADSGMTHNGNIGTTVLKVGDDTTAMEVLDGSIASTYPDGGFFPIILSDKNGGTTTIRASYTGDANTNITIEWTVYYIPLTSGANLT